MILGGNFDGNFDAWRPTAGMPSLLLKYSPNPETTSASGFTVSISADSCGNVTNFTSYE